MSDWQRLKYFCTELAQYGLNVPARDYEETGTRFIRTSDISDRGGLIDAGVVYVDDSVIDSNYRLVEGDLLLSRSGTLGRCFRYQAAIGTATFAGYLIRFRPGPESEPRYLEYCTQALFFQQAIEAGAPSSTISNFNAERYANLLLPRWPLDRQRAIADYLDIETGRIDALISKKRRMIELLKQRWRAEVMSTVYGDDSVRWGAIRYVVDLLPGYAFPSSSFVDGGVRLLRGANIAPGRLRWDTNVVYLSPEDRPQLSEYELAEGDLVLGMDRPVIGSGMRVALVTASDLPCLLVQRVARIRATKRADAQYIRVLIESDAFVAYFSPITTGVSVPHISADQILSFRAPLPSYDVQHALATRLHRERTRLTAMSNRLTAQIVLLAERRQALITTAVTGELAIRGMAG